MNSIDSLDEQIAQLLGEDARQSSEKLAKKLRVSAATVRRRLRKLINNDMLRIVGVVDPASFGFPVWAVITPRIDRRMVNKALEQLEKRPEARFISTTTGRWDILVTARFRSNDHLSEFLEKELANLDGLRDTETAIALQVKKVVRNPLSDL